MLSSKRVGETSSLLSGLTERLGTQSNNLVSRALVEDYSILLYERAMSGP